MEKNFSEYVSKEFQRIANSRKILREQGIPLLATTDQRGEPLTAEQIAAVQQETEKFLKDDE